MICMRATEFTQPDASKYSAGNISQEWRLVRDYLASRYLHAVGRVAAGIARR